MTITIRAQFAQAPKLWALTVLVGLFGCGQRPHSQDAVAAGHESNGGNYIAEEFTAWARSIYIDLRSPGYDLLTPSQLAAFGAAIDQTPVEVVDAGAGFVDNGGHVVNARVVPNDAVNGHKIQLDQTFWQTASGQDQSVCRLVLHEYMRVIGVDKELPEDQYAVSGRWRGSCGEPQGQNTANLDFEASKDAGARPVNWSSWSAEKDYEMVADTAVVHSGKWSARLDLIATRKTANEFGTLTQCVDATPYLESGQIHYEGWLKTKDVGANGAAIWLRVDGAKEMSLSFDNMDGRSLTGTNDWTNVVIDLPVPPQAATICFGVLLEDVGTVWADDLIVRPGG